MKTTLTAILLLLCNWAFAQSADILSPRAEITILTMGPGQEELYSAFGHSAIRVYDPVNRLDRVYNYGVFDFDQPNFYLNFTRGHLNYKLDTVDYPRFRYAYMYYDRFIHEQVLNFDSLQRQKFYDFLEWNMLPENQYYYYDYFYDNCATRLRDALIEVFGDDVEFDGSYITTDYTIRELTDLYLPYQPWGDLGIDICLGLPMDKTATPSMYMFLPDYIESAFDHATLEKDGEKVPLIKGSRQIYSPRGTTDNQNSWFTPLNTFTWLAMIMFIISVMGYRKKRHKFWIDGILFIIIGALGLLLFMLWFATDHHAAARNMNLLWAIPTHLVAGIALYKKNKPKWLSKYFMATALIGALNLALWPVIPQMLHYSLIPIVLILIVRSLKIWDWLKTKGQPSS